MPGDGLTEDGVAQARRLGKAVAAEKVELGVATQLLRTQETLMIALSEDLPRIVVPELDEIDFGSFEGGPLAEYRSWAASALPTSRPPGDGESRGQAAARFARGLQRLLERPEVTALVVGHALGVRYVVDAARGLVPAPLIAPVEQAVIFELEAEDARAAAELLEEWSRAPRFRDHRDGGRAGAARP